VVLVVRGDTLLTTMSEYLVDRIEAKPNIEVRCRSEVLAGSGDGHLEQLTLVDRMTQATSQVAASWLFIFIGASPRTEWLGADVVRDKAGFVLTGLASRYPDCWTFAVDGLVGATPELLLALHDGQLTSLVLAGTTARGGDEADDQRLHEELLKSSKNLEEHRYALDSLTQALQPLTTSMTTSPTPYLLELSNVVHLATAVSGTVVGGRDALDLIAAVNPSAAVGGTPTPVAVRMLRELEGFDRGRYAGPVGWIDANGQGEWGIALRCGLLEGNAARLFAGCGIVAESDPDAEVAEAQSKFVPMRDALEGVRD